MLDEQSGPSLIEGRFVTTIRPIEPADSAFKPAQDGRWYARHTVPASFEPGLFVQDTFKPPQATYANGCHTVEVEVDPGTGKADILRYCVAHDCGTIVNPLIVDGQIQVASPMASAMLCSNSCATTKTASRSRPRWPNLLRWQPMCRTGDRPPRFPLPSQSARR